MTLARPRDGRKVTKVVDGQGPDLRQAQAQQPEPDDDLITQPYQGAVLAGRYQAKVGLLVAEPAPRVLRLDLAVGAPVGAERTGRAPQVFCRIVVDDPAYVAPPQESSDFGAALVDGVVGRMTGRAKADQLTFGQLRRMTATRSYEQPTQRASIVEGRLRVRVTPAELLDQVVQASGRRPEGDYLSGGKAAASP